MYTSMYAASEVAAALNSLARAKFMLLFSVMLRVCSTYCSVAHMKVDLQYESVRAPCVLLCVIVSNPKYISGGLKNLLTGKWHKMDEAKNTCQREIIIVQPEADTWVLTTTKQLTRYSVDTGWQKMYSAYNVNLFARRVIILSKCKKQSALWVMPRSKRSGHLVSRCTFLRTIFLAQRWKEDCSISVALICKKSETIRTRFVCPEISLHIII